MDESLKVVKENVRSNPSYTILLSEDFSARDMEWEILTQYDRRVVHILQTHHLSQHQMEPPEKEC